MVYFEILRGTDGYYWRIRGANHEILAHSETLASVANCRNAIAVVQAGANGAPVLRPDVTAY